ncbi:MAG: VOC family protein [Proteobacteria bacterium]|jgi:catechol 2,3-dioxygenase-like lactoylglutathione lyase family enzyme|nr:VOC family protein [Pseudomonadota bacterium]
MSSTPDSANSPAKGLHHAAFTTRKTEETFEFYSTKLGMKLIHAENHLQGDGYFRHFFFSLGNDEAIGFFELHDVGEEAEFKTEISTGLGLPPWANHIAFRLDTLEELETMTKRMHEAGIDQVMQIDHGWCVSIYTLDPNGILVEFCVTTDEQAFAQTEEEALRILRQSREEIAEEARKETSVGESV